MPEAGSPYGLQFIALGTTEITVSFQTNRLLADFAHVLGTVQALHLDLASRLTYARFAVLHRHAVTRRQHTGRAHDVLGVGNADGR